MEASPSIVIREERLSKDEVKKGLSKTVKKFCKAQADAGLASAYGEVGPGGEVAKTVCFNSQPEFAPSQEVAQFNGQVRTSPLHLKSILKSPKVSVDSTATNIVPQSPVKSPPIDLTACISSPSQSNPTPPLACQLPKSLASFSTSPPTPSTTSDAQEVESVASVSTSPTSPSTPSRLDQVPRLISYRLSFEYALLAKTCHLHLHLLNQVKVTPPNSPSVLASVRKSSQAKPKSERR